MLEMDDMVKVKYDNIEQLFCQKVIEKKEKDKEEAKAKPPTEVSSFLLIFYVLFSSIMAS